MTVNKIPLTPEEIERNQAIVDELLEFAFLHFLFLWKRFGLI